MTITSKPVVTYFELDVQGLGGAIYILLSDAEVDFEKKTFPMGEWIPVKEKLIATGASPNGTVPVLELDGKTYVHQLPILRLLSHRLGKYNGKDIEEAYEIDSFADLLVDFFKAWATSNWGDDAAKKTFAVEKEPRYLAGVERFLVKHNGPYILGNEPSYADFKLLSVLLDTKSDLSSYPHIKTFSEAIRSRPGVQKYLSTLA